jgi:enoyl-[acyl-carrier-protein] reductase (NADH)
LLGSGSRGITGETMMVDAGFFVMGMDTAKPAASE